MQSKARRRSRVFDVLGPDPLTFSEMAGLGRIGEATRLESITGVTLNRSLAVTGAYPERKVNSGRSTLGWMRIMAKRASSIIKSTQRHRFREAIGLKQTYL